MPSIIEALESRTLQTSDGRGSATRKFFFSGYTTARSVFNLIGKKVGDVTVPKKGVSHPEFGGIIARDYTVKRVGGHNDLWEMIWTYEQITASALVAPDEAPEQLPNEVNYVELSSEIRAEFVNWWRDGNVQIPFEGNAGEPDYENPSDPDNDIGGRPIDAFGNPTSVIRRIQELTITETVTVPRFGSYGLFRFTRNSEPFLGAGKGRVLYRGCSVRRTGVSVYVVSHSFIDDEYFHLIQQPRLDQDGRPLIEEDEKSAKDVYWIQPFLEQTDLNNISSNLAGFIS